MFDCSRARAPVSMTAMVRWLDASDVPRGEQVQLMRYVHACLPDFAGGLRS